ncbi:MAG: helix-turn-helix transcriptional regulator, partial [Croceibacterium sp.]
AAANLAASFDSPGRAAPTPPAPQADETFGSRVKQLRHAHGLSLDELAGQVGVSKPALWKWERGEARPRAAALERLAQVLGRTPGALLFGGEPATSTELAPAAQGTLQPILDAARDQVADALGMDTAAIELSVTIHAHARQGRG